MDAAVKNFAVKSIFNAISRTTWHMYVAHTPLNLQVVKCVWLCVRVYNFDFLHSKRLSNYQIVSRAVSIRSQIAIDCRLVKIGIAPDELEFVVDLLLLKWRSVELTSMSRPRTHRNSTNSQLSSEAINSRRITTKQQNENNNLFNSSGIGINNKYIDTKFNWFCVDRASCFRAKMSFFVQLFYPLSTCSPLSTLLPYDRSFHFSEILCVHKSTDASTFISVCRFHFIEIRIIDLDVLQQKRFVSQSFRSHIKQMPVGRNLNRRSVDQLLEIISFIIIL